MTTTYHATPEAYRLIHDGALALSRVERNGICVDEAYLAKAIKSAHNRHRMGEEDLKADPLWDRWRRKHGERAKLSSREQLASLLFDDLGYQHSGYTAKTEKYASTDDALEMVDHPFVAKWLDTYQYRDSISKFLEPIRSEVVEGFLHCNFNLNIAESMRSSSDSPNFQNFPMRDPEYSKLIRTAFIARSERRVLVEIDYSGIEVRISYCYHGDPQMRTYLLDPTTDMHRDMAGQIYLLSKADAAHKPIRNTAKGQFVFAQFYGSYYLNCAKALWRAIDKFKLKLPDGTPLRDHLADNGIKELGACDPKEKPVKGTFEYHVREVEEDFWGRRFRTYSDWKKETYARYQKEGGFTTKTGFAYRGHLSRNQVTNFGIQGSAFHCTLRALTIIDAWLAKNRMESKIVGQIHDSIVFDCDVDELQDVLTYAARVMTKQVPAEWDWITIPLVVEAEVAPLKASWYDKRAAAQDSNGLWSWSCKTCKRFVGDFPGRGRERPAELCRCVNYERLQRASPI